MIETILFVVSISVTIFSVLGMLCKKMTNLILCQLLATSLLCLQYALENAWSAAYTLPPAIALLVISFIYNHKSKSIPKWITNTFIIIFGGIVLFQILVRTKNGWDFIFLADVLVFAALVLFVICITRKKSYQSRICAVINSLLWLTYDIICAPSAILTHSAILLFTVIGIICNDRKEWKSVVRSTKGGKLH